MENVYVAIDGQGFSILDINRAKEISYEAMENYCRAKGVPLDPDNIHLFDIIEHPIDTFFALEVPIEHKEFLALVHQNRLLSREKMAQNGWNV